MFYPLAQCSTKHTVRALMDNYIYLNNNNEGYQFFEPGHSDDWECPICRLVVRDAYQVNCCGKVLCKCCLMKWTNESNHSSCPVCRSENIRSKYFKDTRSDREIKRIRVFCNNEDSGCDWSGEVRDMENHVENCLYRLLQCKDCKETFTKQKLETHFTDECPKRKSKCCVCDEEGTYDYITSEHPKKCPEVEMQCLNTGCDLIMKRCEMTSHIDVCPKQIVKCPFSEMGCQFTSERENLSAHTDREMTLHLNLVPQYKQDILHSDVVKLQRNHSKSIYTGQGGYKLSLCVDVDSQDFVCLRCSLMSGVNDDFLEFPLKGKFTITLLNQIEDANHITKNCICGMKSDEILLNEGETFKILFIPLSSCYFNREENTQYCCYEDRSFYFRISFTPINLIVKPWLLRNTDAFVDLLNRR